MLCFQAESNQALRETNTGSSVASATIANNEFFNDQGQRREVTTFVHVTCGESPERTSRLWLRKARRS
jgi:single-stranded DNA-binding protein